MSGHYLGFAATPALRRDAETFILHIHKGFAASQQGLLQQVLDGFINQCLETFFITPGEVAGLSPMGRKILTTAVATIRKTVQMVVGRIVRKLSNREMQPLARFIDEVLFRNPDQPGQPAFIAFELEADLAGRFRQLQVSCQGAGPVPQAAVVAIFQSVAAEAISSLFEEPVRSLHLGPVLNRVALMGIDTTRSVVGSLIRRIFSTLDDAQIRAVLDYFCGMILDQQPGLDSHWHAQGLA